MSYNVEVSTRTDCLIKNWPSAAQMELQGISKKPLVSSVPLHGLDIQLMINGNRPFNKHKAKLNYAFYQPTTLWGERLPMVKNNKL
jgi:hypothetical protein